MAHLIKLFNCSGNHYHHHRCSIIYHFWRVLLTSGAHSPALLKRGQISPTPFGVSAGCDLNRICVARKLTVKQRRWKGSPNAPPKKYSHPPSSRLRARTDTRANMHTKVLHSRTTRPRAQKSRVKATRSRIRYFLFSRMRFKGREAAGGERGVLHSLSTAGDYNKPGRAGEVAGAEVVGGGGLGVPQRGARGVAVAPPLTLGSA